MATAVIRRACWSFLTIGFVLVSSIGLFAQLGSPASTSARDLNATLAELARVAPATIQDLDVANQQQGGLLHHVTFWRGNKGYDTDTAKALRRNLQVAVPNLVRDTQTSGGSLSTSFKLYRDLTEVCDSMRYLIAPGLRENKAGFSALNNDLSDMNRLREEVYSYVERSATLVEARNPQTLSSAARPKKVIVYNDMPANPAPKKRQPADEGK